MLMKTHTGKVGPRTLRCDPGPRALEWDPKVRPQERTLQWDPKVGPQGWTCIYGDPAQPLSIHYQASFSKQNLTPNPVNYNMALSQTRVSAKWLFKEIKTYFKFVSLKSIVRIGRSSNRRCSVRKDVLRNFAKFTGKHLCQSLFLNKVTGLG